MRKAKLSPKGKLFFSVILFILIIILVFYYYDAKMSPIIKDMALSKAEDFATEIINASVLEELGKENLSYDEIITLEKTDQGFISAVKTNSATVNRIKADIALAVMHDSVMLEEESIEIPIGSLTDIEFLAGRGPKISVKIVPLGTVFVNINQEFIPAGINQTLHRIMLEVIVEADLVFPTETETASYKSTFILSETIIVGDVPNVYADIGAFATEGGNK